MEINQKIVNDIVGNLGIKPDKDLGQNFLISSDTCSKISDALESNKNDVTLEIGGGLGSLTHFLVNKSSSFDVVDIDSRMCNFLKSVYTENEANIIHEDIRNIDVSQYTKIIGNLPYYITTELITFLLEKSIKCKKMVFMIQTEALNRFTDTKGKEYGAVSVLISLLGNIKRLFTVKPGCFYPVPKCSSVVFSIDLTNKTNREDALGTYKLAKQLFLNRRKTLLNNLSNYLKNKEKASDILKKIALKETTRPEEISPEIYYQLFLELKNL